jgi:hypothetical protein
VPVTIGVDEKGDANVTMVEPDTPIVEVPLIKEEEPEEDVITAVVLLFTKRELLDKLRFAKISIVLSVVKLRIESV